MIYTFIFVLFLILVVAHAIYTAPEMDEDTGRIIKPGKKLSELFKKNKE
jgi:hypothetical protein